MPRRVSSTRKRWISLARAATTGISKLVAPATRVICPMPAPEALLGLAGLDAGAVEDLEDPDRAELGELLLERHAAQEVVDAIGDRERRIEVGRGGDAQPLTAPVVRPRMSWRSANA